jgi:hypothetical protein
VTGEGGFAAARFEGLRFTREKGWEPVGKEWFYARGTGEESLVAARLASERFEVPRVDVAAARARVDYAKILEQAQGGLPRAVLAEEGDIFASVSRTPRIPVKEVFTPGKVPGLPPILLPKLPLREERRGSEAPSLPLKIPSVERVGPPDISVKPFAAPAPLTMMPLVPKPEVAEFTAPRLGELPLQPQVPRVEPRTPSLTAPKLEPRLELPQLQLPKAEPRTAPRAEPPPRLPAPPLPVFGGVRDAPVPRLPRLFGSREWLVRWFGPGAPEVITAARSRKTARRRGGRR